MADELDPDRVRSPRDLIVFLNRLREDIEREMAEMKRRQAAGEELAGLSAHYATFEANAAALNRQGSPRLTTSRGPERSSPS